MNRPYISVIMNTYKANQQWLREAAISYLNQKSVDVQLIISTVSGDPSLETLSDLSVELVVSPAPGIYPQLNNALKAIKGDWYAYASGDDVALDDKLISEHKAAVQTGAKIVYSGYYKVNASLQNRKRYLFSDFKINTLFDRCYITDCALISREIIDKYGPFDLLCGNLAYYDFWFRVYAGEGNVFYNLRKPTWLYRQHGSQNKRKWQGDPEKKRKQMQLKNMVKTKHACLRK